MSREKVIQRINAYANLKVDIRASTMLSTFDSEHQDEEELALERTAISPLIPLQHAVASVACVFRR